MVLAKTRETKHGSADYVYQSTARTPVQKSSQNQIKIHNTKPTTDLETVHQFKRRIRSDYLEVTTGNVRGQGG